MPLTDTAVRNAKPKDKPYKLSDSGGLFLLAATALAGLADTAAPDAAPY